MKKTSMENLSILAKGFIISIIPIVVIRLETFFMKSYSMGFLISGLYEMLVIGVIGLIFAGVYMFFKNKYEKISKKVVIGLVVVYYVLFLIYLILIIYFQTQAPLFWLKK